MTSCKERLTKISNLNSIFIRDKYILIFLYYRDSSPNSSPNEDLQRKLNILEQDAAVLKTKVQSLEKENEKVTSENKKLAVAAARLTRKDSQYSTVENQKALELVKVKEDLTKAEDKCKLIEEKLKHVLETAADKLPPRTPKKFSDANTKFQLQVSISYIFN